MGPLAAKSSSSAQLLTGFLAGALLVTLFLYASKRECSGLGHDCWDWARLRRLSLRAAASPPPGLLPVPWSPPVLSEAQLRRGLAYYGSGTRLERLVARLMAGQRVTAVALGGSVTVGAGASARGVTSYVPRFFSFLNSSFPHREHMMVNKAIGGTNAGTFGTCLERLVPQDADLVTVELTYNEHPSLPYSSPDRKGFEALLRKLLRLPGAPAVLLLHHFSWYHSAGDGADEGLFYREAEVQLSTLAQYYDIPSPSLRDAVYPEMLADRAPFKRSKVQSKGWRQPTTDQEIPQAAEAERGSYFYTDVVHPADHGHAALAELLAHTVRVAARNVAAAGGPAAVLAASSSGDLSEAPALAAWSGALQQPMIPGNADAATSLCVMQEDFQHVVKRTSGFEWAAEKPGAASFVEQKWGWRSVEPGAWLELEFSSQTDGQEGLVMVLLGYLRSNRGMALAKVKCVSGCTCRPSFLDGFWTSRSTLRNMHKFEASQHPACRLRVTAVERGEGDEGAAAAAGKGRGWDVGAKVQLSGVMVAGSQPALWAYPGQAGDLMDMGAR